MNDLEWLAISFILMLTIAIITTCIILYCQEFCRDRDYKGNILLEL